jgi:hypothetical protein
MYIHTHTYICIHTYTYSFLLDVNERPDAVVVCMVAVKNTIIVDISGGMLLPHG